MPEVNQFSDIPFWWQENDPSHAWARSFLWLDQQAKAVSHYAIERLCNYLLDQLIPIHSPQKAS